MTHLLPSLLVWGLDLFFTALFFLLIVHLVYRVLPLPGFFLSRWADRVSLWFLGWLEPALDALMGAWLPTMLLPLAALLLCYALVKYISPGLFQLASLF